MFKTRATSRSARWSIRPLAGVALLLFAASSASAISVREYSAKVAQAVTALDGLAQLDESETSSEYSKRSAETLKATRFLLPVKETVEWNGSSVTVDHAWLHTELDKYASAKPEDQRAVLRSITERLQAVTERLREADTTGKAGPDTKAERGRKLAEILKRSEYAARPKGQNAIQRLVERFVKWLQQFLPRPKPLAPGNAGILTQIAQVLVVLVALGVLVYVLRMFLPRLWRNQRAQKKEKKAARIVLGEKLEPDQTARDILAEAEALARRGDIRAAIRKAYIALLVELGERKVISLAQHKTNRDYLRAVGHVQPLYTDVKQLTETFERHWYGLTQASESDWRTFRATYEQALKA